MANQVITVRSKSEMEQRVNQYLVNGYTVAGQSSDSTILRKPKEFNIFLGALGFFLCVIGFFVYLLIYSMQKDRVIEIRLDTTPKMAEDRNWWWDDHLNEWRNVDEAAPPNAKRSDDGKHWWDGQAWRRVPA